MGSEIIELTSSREARENSIDQHVGLCIRLRRRELKISQTELGDHLGITFQQVQKYERGANRVSASKLFLIAEVLQVPISSFFVGLCAGAETGEDEAVGDEVSRFYGSSYSADLIRLWPQIDTKAKQAVISVIEAMNP